MKKNHSVTTDSRSDSAELPIRLYRAISDVVRHLDDQRARVEHVSDLFSENIEAQRIKLRDYCDKLMFTDPVGYGKKAEDLLWRKVFYEIVGTVKRLNKTAKMDLAEMCMIQTHLQSGIGYYHHLIMKLQSHFRLDLRGIVDFPLLITDCGLKKDKNWWNGKAIESSALEWAHHALHRCLIYLGDISRYLSDLQSSYDHNFAQRYYVQALNWKPECGMPHNQLGTLATNQNYGLDSTYYYMRCLCCTQKFEGAEGNLLHLMENNCKISDEITKGNSKVNVPNVKKLIVAFIHISYSMFYDKINPQINQLYADAFMTLEACMAEVENNKNKVQSSITEPTILNDDMLFKMMVISIMCVQQLKAKNSPQIMGGVALCLTLMSQLVQCALKRIEAILPPRLEPSSAKKNSSQLRRRRRRKNISTSDLSEDENDSVYSMDSDISEEDLIFDECNDSEEEMANGKPAVNGILDEKENANTMLDSDPTKPWRHSLVSRDKTFQHILQLCQDGFLFQAIKIGFHWIFSNQVFLKSCGTSSIPFLTRLVEFLNHLSGIPSLMNLKEIFDDDIVTEETVCTIPLPEDVAVRGLSSLQLAQANLNWDYLRTMPLKPIDEVYTRIVDMLRFGKLISKAQISILTYDEEKQWFGLQADKAVAPKNGIVNHRVSDLACSTIDFKEY
ncbi:protein SMG5 isoform X1 [Cimex lectularius]|uniref:Protein SMG5 n=2 Tax=Cimex lectularius TaxID=79782 RepID=A0A8I6SF59_CIMLE|nr:protein SMG5 isoform X1 [Cimex lectularius]